MLITETIILSVIFTIICGALIYFSLLVDTNISHGKNYVFKRVRYINRMIVKQFIYKNSTIIQFSKVLDLIVKIVLLAIMFLLIPYKNEIIGNKLLIINNIYEDYLIKFILIFSLVPSFNISNKLVINNPFQKTLIELNKLIVVVFNLFIIEQLNSFNNLLIQKYLGVMVSFYIVSLINNNTTYISSNENQMDYIKEKINELIWIVFLVFYFINPSFLVNDIVWFAFIGMLLILLIIYSNMVLKKYIKMRVNQNAINKLLRTSIILSLLNFFILEFYDIF